MRTVHLGDLLVQHGVLTAAQRDAVLAAQKERGGPFGALAEQMFGVNPGAVERAWAEQFDTIAPHVDPRTFPVQHRVLEVISRRQAWQFRVLPLEIRGSDLVLCTTREALVRALKFTGWRLGHAVQFVIAEANPLGEAMERYYPMAGMRASMLSDPLPMAA
ncbi:MAG: hypothetical protein SFY69_07165 [Planctomycetota bacterium]|nr:hypothetical protein [Planctomycetota bacterium]